MVTFASEAPVANVRNPGEFSPDEFSEHQNVPVFAEHQTTASDGRDISFGYEELKAVADRCNRRIAETGDYAAICIGHTPSPEQRANGAPVPDLVGFAGPFRMGQIGRPGTRQRWAILADLHIFKDKYDEFRMHPRRSPELWLEEKYEDMFLDPIALLGAEAPRLDLGLLYSSIRAGRLVERYAAAAPGSSNVFIPDHGKKDYQSPAISERPRPAMTSPEDVKAIVDAIEQQPWVAWVKAQMAEEATMGAGGGMEDGGGGPNSMAPAGAQQAEGMVPPNGPPAADMAPSGPPAPPGPPQMTPPPPGPPQAPAADKEQEKMMGQHYAAGEKKDDDEGPDYKHQMYAALDAMGDDAESAIEEYMAHKVKVKDIGKYESAVDPSAKTYDETADEGDGVHGRKRDIDESKADKEAYAAGSAGDQGQQPAQDSSVAGVDGSKSEGSVSAEGEPKPDASTYKCEQPGEPERYQLEKTLRGVQERLDEAETKLRYEKEQRTDAQRSQKLVELHHHGYTFDLEDETERWKFARVESDELFSTHLEEIAKNYQRAPLHDLPYSREGSIFSQDRPGAGVERGKYSKEQSERAFQIAERKALAGEPVDYEEVLDSVLSGEVVT